MISKVVELNRLSHQLFDNLIVKVQDREINKHIACIEHKGEKCDIICLDLNCSTKGAICRKCQYSSHKDHSGWMPIESFLVLVKSTRNQQIQIINQQYSQHYNESQKQLQSLKNARLIIDQQMDFIQSQLQIEERKIENNIRQHVQKLENSIMNLFMDKEISDNQKRGYISSILWQMSKKEQNQDGVEIEFDCYEQIKKHNDENLNNFRDLSQSYMGLLNSFIEQINSVREQKIKLEKKQESGRNKRAGWNVQQTVRKQERDVQNCMNDIDNCMSDVQETLMKQSRCQLDNKVNDSSFIRMSQNLKQSNILGEQQQYVQQQYDERFERQVGQSRMIQRNVQNIKNVTPIKRNEWSFSQNDKDYDCIIQSLKQDKMKIDIESRREQNQKQCMNPVLVHGKDNVRHSDLNLSEFSQQGSQIMHKKHFSVEISQQGVQ